MKQLKHTIHQQLFTVIDLKCFSPRLQLGFSPTSSLHCTFHLPNSASITSLFSAFVILTFFFFFLSSYKQSALQLICVPTVTKGPVKNVSSVYMIKCRVNIATVFVCACFLHHCFSDGIKTCYIFFFPSMFFFLPPTMYLNKVCFCFKSNFLTLNLNQWEDMLLFITYIFEFETIVTLLLLLLHF